MAYEWAKPGVKVVCVYEAPGPGLEWSSDSPCAGKVYTISRAFFDIEGDFVVDFLELVRSEEALDDFGFDTGYLVRRFRPLITKTQEQDIEMFLRLASPSPLERLDLLAERMNELAED